LKARELTAALCAVVGATCVVAFAAFYLFSPNLPLGPVLSAPQIDPPVTFGPPEPPPGMTTAPGLLVDDVAERTEAKPARSTAVERWRPDTPAVVPTASPKRSTPKRVQRKPAEVPVASAAPRKPAVVTSTRKKAIEGRAKSTRPVTTLTTPSRDVVVPQPEVVAERSVAVVVENEGRFEQMAAAPLSLEDAPPVPPLLADAPALAPEPQPEGETLAPADWVVAQANPVDVAAAEPVAPAADAVASATETTTSAPDVALGIAESVAQSLAASAASTATAIAPAIGAAGTALAAGAVPATSATKPDAPPSDDPIVSEEPVRSDVPEATVSREPVVAVKAEPFEAHEPAEPFEAHEPAEPIEAHEPAEPIEAREPIVVAPAVVAETDEAPSRSANAEPELAGGADIAEAIATSALDLASEDEGALDTLTAADVEADRWLASVDGLGGYPGAPGAGTAFSFEATPASPETLAIALPEEVDTIPSVSALVPNDYSALRERFLELAARVDQLPAVKPFEFVPPKAAPAVAETEPEETELVVAARDAEPAKTAEELQAEWAREAKGGQPEPELVAPKPRIREALVSDAETREERRDEEAALADAVRRQVSQDVTALGALDVAPATLVAQAPRGSQRSAVTTQPEERVVTGGTAAPRPVLDARQELATMQSSQGSVLAARRPPVAPVVGAATALVPDVPARRSEAESLPRTAAVETAARASEMEAPTRDTRQTIFGTLQFGKRVEAWLEAKRGHVELYLQPENTRDPSDTIHVDYAFPNPEFVIERGGLVGRYRLIAGVFSPSSPVAVAQVPYGKLLSEDNYKERVRFYLDDATFERALAGTAAGLAKSVALHLSLYSAGTSNYHGKGADGEGSFRQPTPVAGASVRLIGVGDVAPATSDAEGNARFSRVPSRSDLLVEVTAPGFMKTYAVVPVADGPTYQPVYLVARDKVEAVTTYFTRRPQQNGHAVVMGRVFDTTKRRPEAGQKVRLQNRQGPALYFGALPDLTLEATSRNGLFGFFNVAPSFRSIAREKRDAIPYLMHLRPNTGTYVELGRSGAKALVGRLYDPFAKKPVVGQVRLVGSETIRAECGEDGTFRFDGLEFPPGIITLEVDADGYPMTWLNVSWSPREPEKLRTFFLVDDDTVSRAMHDFTKFTPKPDRGSLVGGAESELFKKTQGCLSVSLESLEHGAAKVAQGPHPLLPSQAGGPLCVSARSPGFAFHDLPPGEWNLRWADAQGQTLRTRVVRVGQGRVTVVVN
jgi:hypothetical protein